MELEYNITQVEENIEGENGLGGVLINEVFRLESDDCNTVFLCGIMVYKLIKI